MAIGSFKDLCDGFCEVAGVPSPALEADSDGLIAFHVILRGVTINVVHSPQSSADHAFILVECGEPPQRDAQRPLQALLEANFFPLQVHPPTFGRNPVSGEAVLQFVYPFFEASPTGLFELIDKGIDIALRWQQGSPLEDEEPLDQAALPQQSSMFASFA